MGRRLLSLTTLIAMGLTLLSGCAGSGPHLQRYKTKVENQACKIAILPFLNKTDFNQGDKILYRMLLTKLVQHQILHVALEGDVTTLYRELQLKPWQQPSPEQMQIIASRLDVDLLIGGKILEMQETMQGNQLNPSIKIQLQVYSGQNGTRQWSTYHERQGTHYRKIMHFGINNTVSQLGNNIIEEILTLWKEEALLQCQN